MALREVILTVLANRRMTGYEIARDFDQVLSFFWHASHQQIYRELARLDGDGCVQFRVVPQHGKPDRKVYQITKAGRGELKRWLAEPTPPQRPQYDLLVKLMAGLMLDPRSIRSEFRRVSAEGETIMKRFREFETSCLARPAEEFSAYERAMYLTLRRGLLLGQAQMAWLGEVNDFFETGRLRR